MLFVCLYDHIRWRSSTGPNIAGNHLLVNFDRYNPSNDRSKSRRLYPLAQSLVGFFGLPPGPRVLKD